jgi:hypothetical protein
MFAVGLPQHRGVEKQPNEDLNMGVNPFAFSPSNEAKKFKVRLFKVQPTPSDSSIVPV